MLLNCASNVCWVFWLQQEERWFRYVQFISLPQPWSTFDKAPALVFVLWAGRFWAVVCLTANCKHVKCLTNGKCLIACSLLDGCFTRYSIIQGHEKHPLQELSNVSAVNCSLWFLSIVGRVLERSLNKLHQSLASKPQDLIISLSLLLHFVIIFLCWRWIAEKKNK